jgi:mono/diheme cytochrome c family protein
MPARRITIAAPIVVAVLLVASGFAWTWRPSIAPISTNERPGTSEQTFRHGAELAAIGYCNSCHQAKAGRPYAGGRAIPTPFGAIFSSNITPDAATGIGVWSEAAFQRAMHEGVDREGRQLYPAFPYDHFTKATDADIRAIYLFLMNQPPVHNAIPANQLEFPLNVRPIVAGWKLLFLREVQLQPDASKSPEWNRGRYLVEGLGHCGGCHTPRNVLGAEIKGRAYTGGLAEGWTAPPLNSETLAVHKWTVDQMAEYLSTGWSRWHGAAAGPMAVVTESLAQAPSTDVHAMATYIASLSSESGSRSESATSRANKPAPKASAEAIAIFTGACANCHDDRDGVGPSKALTLSLSSAVRQSGAGNAVRVVLQGIAPPPGAAGAYMPSFDGILSDQQIATVVEYVRARYSSEPPWTDVPQQIAAARQ